MPDPFLIILDPSLKNMGGHYFEYDAALAAAAQRRGMPTQIYAHKSCDAGLNVAHGHIHPWFSTEWSAAGGGAKTLAQGLLNRFPIALRLPLNRLARWLWRLAKKKRPQAPMATTLTPAAERFGNEVVTALAHASCNRDDIIFLPTIRTSELFALWQAVQHTPVLQALQYHVVLRRDAAEMDLPEQGAPGISVLFQQISAAPCGSAFSFYCDTSQLCDDYGHLSSGRLPFRLLPIPFPHTEPDRTALETWSAGAAIKLVYLGGARTEKGFHLLPPARNFLQQQSAGNILWRLQAPQSGEPEEPEVTAARRRLSSVRDGSVALVERNLTSAEFQSLLLSADIVLLPYLPEFYRARSSGILVQVLAAGKPVIVPAASWLASQTEGVGAVTFAKPEDFPRAVLDAVRQLASLSRAAQARALAYAAFHSADALLAALLQGAPEPRS